jgi:hypothetical protein
MAFSFSFFRRQQRPPHPPPPTTTTTNDISACADSIEGLNRQLCAHARLVILTSTTTTNHTNKEEFKRLLQTQAEHQRRLLLLAQPDDAHNNIMLDACTAERLRLVALLDRSAPSPSASGDFALAVLAYTVNMGRFVNDCRAYKIEYQ